MICTDNPINKERSSGGGLEGGAIAGIVVPIIVVIIVIVIIVFIKKRQKAPKTPKLIQYSFMELWLFTVHHWITHKKFCYFIQTASNDDTKMPMNSPPKDQGIYAQYLVSWPNFTYPLSCEEFLHVFLLTSAK